HAVREVTLLGVSRPEAILSRAPSPSSASRMMRMTFKTAAFLDQQGLCAALLVVGPARRRAAGLVRAASPTSLRLPASSLLHAGMACRATHAISPAASRRRTLRVIVVDAHRMEAGTSFFGASPFHRKVSSHSDIPPYINGIKPQGR